MMWDRLKLMRCPKSNGELQYDEVFWIYKCQHPNCDFKINKERFDEVVENLYKPKRQRPQHFGSLLDEESNMSALNNLGRNTMSEDYSD